MSSDAASTPGQPTPGDGGARLSESTAAALVDAMGWESRHREAAELHATRRGPALATRLERFEPADADEAALVEAIDACERLASWAAATQARVIAELDRRERGARGAFLADEVAAALTVTSRVAEGKVALALGMERAPLVADALSRGDIDVRRATVIVEELDRLDERAARKVAVEVLPQARTCTAPQLRARLRRMELLRDSKAAAERHRRACEQRRVEVTPAPDSMAWLSAYLPADHARAVHDALTAVAGDAAPEDGRTLDQRRADALVDVTTRWLDAGMHPDGTPLPTRQGRRPHLAVTASAAILLGLTDEPAELQGYGPIPPDMARRIAARATWQPLLVDATTGEPLAQGTTRYAPTQRHRDVVALRDRTCVFPGCRMPAARCDVDHVEPWTADGGPDQTRVDNLQALCRHHHQAKTHGGWTPLPRADGATAWLAPTGHLHVRPSAHEPPERPPTPPLPKNSRFDLYPPPY